MPSLPRPLQSTSARVVAVVHLLLVEDVAERIPVGRALHRHVDGIVGVTDVGHDVLPARRRRRCRWRAWCGSDSSARRTGRSAARCDRAECRARTPCRCGSASAAFTMSSGVMWLSVPIWSSLPQRPQFLSFCEASAIAFLPTVMFMGVSSRTDAVVRFGAGILARRAKVHNRPRLAVPLHFMPCHAAMVAASRRIPRAREDNA